MNWEALVYYSLIGEALFLGAIIILYLAKGLMLNLGETLFCSSMRQNCNSPGLIKSQEVLK
jgi:hypothetical protein